VVSGEWCNSGWGSGLLNILVDFQRGVTMASLALESARQLTAPSAVMLAGFTLEPLVPNWTSPQQLPTKLTPSTTKKIGVISLRSEVQLQQRGFSSGPRRAVAVRTGRDRSTTRRDHVA
jgi:hypothetical protein|tara:strand:- start:2802 stop:3158 length:357 start_codon:yes stop_codon:yes gene_type:complete